MGADVCSRSSEDRVGAPPSKVFSAHGRAVTLARGERASGAGRCVFRRIRIALVLMPLMPSVARALVTTSTAPCTRLRLVGGITQTVAAQCFSLITGRHEGYSDWSR